MSQSVNVDIQGSGRRQVQVKGGDPNKVNVLASNQNVWLNSRIYYPKGTALVKEGDVWKYKGSPSVRNNRYEGRRNSGSKPVKVRSDKNSTNMKNVLTQELEGGVRVLSYNVKFSDGREAKAGSRLGIDDKGYYILKSNTTNLNEVKRKKKLLQFITQTEYYNNKQKIIDAINLLEGSGITYLSSIKELLISNPDEILNKKFINPKKAVMGVDIKSRTRVKKQIETITRLVYINRLFKRLKEYLSYLKRYDDALEQICCIVDKTN